MNELLQKHGCANVFTIPEGLRELMADITREVLREQPEKISDFVANYLSVLLITREHGIMAVKVLDDLCDCRPPVASHLMSIGLECNKAEAVAQIIKDAIEVPAAEGDERVREYDIVKLILSRFVFDEDTTRKITQVIRNAYRDYIYRRTMLEKILTDNPEEPWETAARHTLEIYKKTKPTFNELAKATETIQAAYRGYHVRRNLLRHIRPKTKPKEEPLGPPVDVSDSREIELGRIIDINVKEDNVSPMLESHASNKLGLGYPAMRTITYAKDTRLSRSQPQQMAVFNLAAADRRDTQRDNFGIKFAQTPAEKSELFRVMPLATDSKTVDWSQEVAKPHTIQFDKAPSRIHTDEMIGALDVKEDGAEHRSTDAASATSVVTAHSTISRTAADLLRSLEIDVSVAKSMETSGDEEGYYDDGDDAEGDDGEGDGE